MRLQKLFRNLKLSFLQERFSTHNVDPNDGEYASSVLIEEPESRLLEMDELELSLSLNCKIDFLPPC